MPEWLDRVLQGEGVFSALWVGLGWAIGIGGIWLALLGLFADGARRRPVVFVWRWWKRGAARRRCPKCWYGMDRVRAGSFQRRGKTVEGWVCPECGKGVRKERRLFRTRRRWWMAGVGLFLALVLAHPVAHVHRAQRAGWNRGWSWLVPRVVLVLLADEEGDLPFINSGRRLPVPNWVADLRTLNRSRLRSAPDWQCAIRFRVERLHYHALLRARAADSSSDLLEELSPWEWRVHDIRPLLDRATSIDPDIERAILKSDFPNGLEDPREALRFRLFGFLPMSPGLGGNTGFARGTFSERTFGSCLCGDGLQAGATSETHADLDRFLEWLSAPADIDQPARVWTLHPHSSSNTTKLHAVVLDYSLLPLDDEELASNALSDYLHFLTVRIGSRYLDPLDFGSTRVNITFVDFVSTRVDRTFGHLYILLWDEEPGPMLEEIEALRSEARARLAGE